MTGHHSAADYRIILVSAGDWRLIRLRGGRSCADSARGTSPSGLPSIASGRGGYARSSVLLRPARSGPKGRLRQVFPHVSIMREIWMVGERGTVWDPVPPQRGEAPEGRGVQRAQPFGGPRGGAGVQRAEPFGARCGGEPRPIFRQGARVKAVRLPPTGAALYKRPAFRQSHLQIMCGSPASFFLQACGFP